MTDGEARQFLIGVLGDANPKVQRIAAETLIERAKERERVSAERLAEQLILDSGINLPPRGPNAAQLQAYIDEVLGPALGLSPPIR